MRRLGRLVLALSAAFAIPAVNTADACIPDGRTVLLMLDSSYSMLRSVSRNSGPTRYVVARQAIASVVDTFPKDGFLALRLYGSQSTIVREDCRDTFLAVPFASAKTNAPIIKLTLDNSHAHGVTPLALALEQAIADFGDRGQDERRIVIITDGAETCGGNPCATAAQMALDGFVIDTVGFLLNDVNARNQLQCIAKVTRGTYVDVTAYLELADRLTKLIGECAVAGLPDWRHWEEKFLTIDFMS